jgi:transketolase
MLVHLGQGISVAIGVALSKKLKGDNQTVFVLTGDGELQEGQIWEAAMYAPHNKVDNLILTVDWNGQQIDGSNEDVLSLGDLEAKWKAFDWDVMHMNGNDMEEVVKVLNEAKAKTGNGKPICILMKTEMGMGVDFMTGTHAWHGKAPNDELTEKALRQLEETLGDY